MSGPSPHALDELMSIAASDYYCSLERKIRALKAQLVESSDRYDALAGQHEALLATLEEKQNHEGELEDLLRQSWEQEREEMQQYFDSEAAELRRQIAAVQPPPPAPPRVVRTVESQCGTGDVREDIAGTAVRELKSHYDDLLAAERRHAEEERRTSHELAEMKLRMERESFEFRLQSERSRYSSDKDRIDDVKASLELSMADKDAHVAAISSTLERERQQWADQKADLHAHADDLLAKHKEQQEAAQTLAISHSQEVRHLRESHAAELRACEEKWKEIIALEQVLRREVEVELSTVRSERNKILSEQRQAVQAAEDKLLLTQLELTKCLEAQREAGDRASASEKQLAERERSLRSKTDQWSAMMSDHAKERAGLQSRVDELQALLDASNAAREKTRQELLDQQLRLNTQRTSSHEQELIALRAQQAEAIDTIRRKSQLEMMNAASSYEQRIKEVSDQLVAAEQMHAGQLARTKRERDDAVRQAKIAQDMLDAQAEEHREQVQASERRLAASKRVAVADAQTFTDPQASTAASGGGRNALLDLQDSIMTKNKHIWQLQLELQDARAALAQRHDHHRSPGAAEDGERGRSSSGVSSLSPPRDHHHEHHHAGEEFEGSFSGQVKRSPASPQPDTLRRGRDVQSLVQYFTRR